MSEHETTRAMLKAGVRAMSIHRYVLRAVRVSSPPSLSGDPSGTGPILQTSVHEPKSAIFSSRLASRFALAFAILFFVSMCFAKKGGSTAKAVF